MNTAQINKLIKKIKRKSTFISVAMVLVALLFILIMESPIKYFLSILTIIIGVAVIMKVQNPSYILFDQCDPQLYYAVVQGVTKQVPLDKQAIVSEFIGDYSSAIQILSSLFEQTKNDYSKLTYLSDLARNAFFAGDYQLCQKCIADFKMLSRDKKINQLFIKRNDFFSAYINGDFKMAKDTLAEINVMAKKQKNSFKCNMLFYNALTDYSMNNFDLSVAEFQEIINRFPNMYLATASTAYINGIKNNTPVEISNPVTTEIPQSATLQKASKKDIIKVIICLIIILGCVIGVPTAINMEYTADTPTLAIEKYDDMDIISSIEYTIEIDDSHIVCIYKNTDDLLGVAYIQAKNEKYKCMIANCDSYILIDDDSNKKPSKMHCSGESSEIVYKWLYDKANAPDDYKIVPLKQNNNTIYFCYKINPPSRYYSNFYGLELNE